MFKVGDVVSYLDMCKEEGVNLQRGMNFRLHGRFSVILMSLRPNAPYADRIEEDGKVLVYEGHDIPQIPGGARAKSVDQPMRTPSGRLTQNGLFYQAALKYKEDQGAPELVRVYQKMRPGIWVYTGLFELVDAFSEVSKSRKVFKFKLVLTDESRDAKPDEVDHGRVVPPSVKLEVWKRDKGRCVICGSKNKLHFDHIIPWSRGGSSQDAENIQLLCARHNLAKRDKIE